MMVDFQKFLIINLFLIPLLNINFAYSKTPDEGGGAQANYFTQMEQICPKISSIDHSLCRKPPELKLTLLNSLQVLCESHLKDNSCDPMKAAALKKASKIPNLNERAEKIQTVHKTFLSCSAQDICAGFESKGALQCDQYVKDGFTKGIISFLMFPVSVSQLITEALRQDRICFENKGQEKQKLIALYNFNIIESLKEHRIPDDLSEKIVRDWPCSEIRAFLVRKQRKYEESLGTLVTKKQIVLSRDKSPLQVLMENLNKKVIEMTRCLNKEEKERVYCELAGEIVAGLGAGVAIKKIAAKALETSPTIPSVVELDDKLSSIKTSSPRPLSVESNVRSSASPSNTNLQQQTRPSPQLLLPAPRPMLALPAPKAKVATESKAPAQAPLVASSKPEAANEPSKMAPPVMNSYQAKLANFNEKLKKFNEEFETAESLHSEIVKELDAGVEIGEKVKLNAKLKKFIEIKEELSGKINKLNNESNNFRSKEINGWDGYTIKEKLKKWDLGQLSYEISTVKIKIGATSINLNGQVVENPQIRVWELSASGKTQEYGELQNGVENSLRTSGVAAMDYMGVYGGGQSNPAIVKLEGGLQGIWKSPGGEYKYKVDAEIIDQAFYDELVYISKEKKIYANPEVASYVIDQKLGTNLVPITVERELNGVPGTMQLFVSDADKARLTPNTDSVGFFDFLIGNHDREHNYLTVQGRPVFFDNGLAFQSSQTDYLKNLQQFKEQYNQFAKKIQKLDTKVYMPKKKTGEVSEEYSTRAQNMKQGQDKFNEWKKIQQNKLAVMLPSKSSFERLKSISENEWKAALEKYLNPSHIEGFLERRRQIIKLVEGLQERFGDDMFSSGNHSPLLRKD